MKRLAALVPNELAVSPGQRVRIESWQPHLERAGWTVDYYPFADARLQKILYASGGTLAKASLLLQCYLRQLQVVSRGPQCDVLFIYREASLVGPALLERMAARKGKPVIFDLDDPIFLPYRSPMNGWFSLLKFPGKTQALFRLSHQVTAINGLIAKYAEQYNPNVTVIPNCVDVERYTPRPREAAASVRLGWMGSHSTMPNLKMLREPLLRLQREVRVPLRVIGAGEPELPGVDCEVRQWSAATEVADLQECDIGLVPVPDQPWNHWKFFYKTIQYMALGLPVVACPMGSNTEIVEDGVNGFLADTTEEWQDRLRTLVLDAELRKRMGEAARRTAVERFSESTQMPRMVDVFERALAAGAKR